MGGNKHKQTKKKPARVVRDTKTKKDLSGAEKDQTDPSIERETGHHCCLPVGMIDFIHVHQFVCLNFLPF